MIVHFPAVLKELNMTPAGIIAHFDISPPDLSLLADLIDHEVTLSLTAGDAIEPPADGVGECEKLPFEPEDDEFDHDEPPPTKRTKAHKRAAK